MDRDVEAAIGALLERRGDAIAEEYEEQNLVVTYNDVEYESPAALADALLEDAPDTVGTVSYDDIDSVPGDAVYHEMLHGQAFTSERPAEEAVARMRMEADDRTNTARGGGDAGGGLNFHVEEEPFIALWSEDDGVRYTAVQLVPEARSASCRRTRITYPGKVFAVTGTIEDIPGPKDLIAAKDDRGDEREPEPGDVTDVEDAAAADEDLCCGVGAEQPEQPAAPIPSAPAQEDQKPGEHTPLDELYSEVFGEPDAFGYDEYEAVMLEAAANLDHMQSALNTMLKYVNVYRLENTEATLPDGASIESTDFYAERLDDHIGEVVAVDGAAEHESLPRAVYVTSESVRNLLAGDTAEFRERFRVEQADAYERLYDAHPATPANASDILTSFAPDREEVNPAHPVVLISTFTMGGRDALDDHLDQIVGQDGGHGGGDFDGNETTRGMYQ